MKTDSGRSPKNMTRTMHLTQITHSSRGFTLLETVMAAALGMLVLAGALSMFVVMQQAQEAVLTRAESSNEIARIHRTMQRTFSTLMMLDRMPAPGEAPGDENAEGENGEDDPGLTDVPADGLELEEPPPVPRLVLEPDPRFPGQDIQRLEIVLASQPIPLDTARDSVQNIAQSTWAAQSWAAETLALDAPPDDGPGIRGSFLLIENARTATDIRDPGWSLWWSPVVGDRVQVATGLRRLRWTLARTGETGLTQHEQYSATLAMDLPAYAEVELEMVNGQYANLMFEIAWSTGEEPSDEAETPGEGGLEGDGASGVGRGTPTGSGGAGGTGRGGRPGPTTPPPPMRPSPAGGSGGEG